MSPLVGFAPKSRKISLVLAALESAEHASCIADKKGSIVYANPAFCRMTGYSPEQLAGTDFMMLQSPHTLREVYRELWHAIREGRTWRGELWYARKDGGSSPCGVVITPFTAPPNNARYYYLVQRDIADRLALEEERLQQQRQLEDEVRRQTAELAKLYDIGAALHTSLDLEETLQVALVAVTAGEGYRFNRAFLFLVDEENPNHLVGQMAVGPFSAEEAGRIWQELAQTPRGEPLAEALRRYSAQIQDRESGLNQLVRDIRIPLDYPHCPLARAMRENRAQVVESTQYPECAGCGFFHHLNTPGFAVVPLVYLGRAEGCIVADNAITRQPILPEELRTLEMFADHAAEAIANALLYRQTEDLVLERDQALADLQTNQQRLVESEKMAALGRMAATVVHELRTPMVIIGGYARNLLKGRPGESTWTTDLEIIRDEISRLEDVVERLLFYARPTEPQRAPGNLNRCVESLILYLAEEIEAHHIHVHLDLASDLPDTLFDDRQMRQVFLNLVSNGIQAMEKGGELTLTTGREGDCIIITVADTGSGIAPPNLRRIFEPFYTTKPRGTGLGLHITQRIVQGHGGRIEIASKAGQGATFIIRMPANPPEKGNGAA